MQGHQVARLVLVDAVGDGDQAFAGHQFGGGLGAIAFEADVAVGQDADQFLGFALDDREARNRTIGNDAADFVELSVGMDGDRIDDHARFEALHGADLIGLLLYGQIAVNDTHAAGLRHGDGQARFGDGIHRRRD